MGRQIETALLPREGDMSTRREGGCHRKEGRSRLPSLPGQEKLLVRKSLGKKGRLQNHFLVPTGTTTKRWGAVSLTK